MALDYNYQIEIDRIFFYGRQNGKEINKILEEIYFTVYSNSFTVSEKVEFAEYILKSLLREERKILIKNLLNEQVVEQRKKLAM